MNTLTSVIIAVIATAGLVVAFMAFSGGGGAQSITLSDANTKTITVSGEAEAFMAPDTASLSFALTRKAGTIAAATESVNSRMGQLLEYLGQFGIEKKDIKTTSYNVNPEYRYEGESGRRVFEGYRVDQRIKIIIRDLENVEGVLGGIGEQDIDQLSGLQFFIDNDEEIREELRKKAIADAKQKAKKLGKDLGVNLTHIVGFSENDQGGQQFYREERSYALSADSAAAPEIPAGENELSSRVSVTFEIE